MSWGTRHIFFGVMAAAALLAAPSAFAAPQPTQDEIRRCTGKQDESAELRISSCSALIEKSRVKKQKADAYAERGKARRAKGDTDGAVADFDEAIKLDPKNTEAYFNRGLAFRDSGDAERAAQDLEQAAKYDKRNASCARYAEPHLLRPARFRDTRSTRLNLAIKLNPNNALALYNRGMAYRAKGEPDRAIPDYDRAIKLNPNDAVAYDSRGLAYRDLRDYERAIQDFDQAIKLKPNYILALNDRGIAYAAQAAMPSAPSRISTRRSCSIRATALPTTTAALPIAIAAKSTAPSRITIRPFCSIRITCWPITTAATPITTSATTTAPSRITTRRSSSTAATRSPFTTAASPISRSTTTIRRCATSAGDQARPEGRAVATTIAASPMPRAASSTAPSPISIRRSSIDPKNALAFYNRGLALRRKGEDERAIADFSQAIRFDPKNALAYYNRGIAYRSNGDIDHAHRRLRSGDQARSQERRRLLRARQRALRQARLSTAPSPTSIRRSISSRIIPPLSTCAGSPTTGKGNADRAIADFDQAVRIDPKYAAALSNRGDAYRRKRDYDHAVADFDEAIKANPNYSGAYFNRGLSYQDKKDYQKAIADFAQAREDRSARTPPHSTRAALPICA